MNHGIKWLIGGCLLLGIVLGIFLGFFKNPEQMQNDSDSANGQDGDAQSVARAAPILGTVPGFRLTDQLGADFGLADLKRKVWVANFVFTTCQGTCPVQSTRMSELQSQLSRDAGWDGIRLVTFTVDPETDTSEVLAKYAAIYEADPRHWKFLTGKREEIWQLCREGFKLPVSPNPDDSAMPILHDTKMVLVDRLGRIRGYYDSFIESDREKLVKDLGHVLPEFQPSAPLRTDFPTDVTHLAQPPGILDLDWLQDMSGRQTEEISSTSVIHDFAYADEIERTGITFEPQIVDEQRWRLQVNHFDHGNGICAADVDGDGHIDVYLLTQAGTNEMWRNRGDGTFEDVTDSAGVGLGEKISVTASFADFDNDGDPDLYVTTVRDGNVLFLNDGAGKFHDVTTDSGLGYSGHSSAPVVFDYDRDGLLDLFLCNVGKYTTDDLVAVRTDLTTNSKAEGAEYYTGITDAFGGHLKSEYTEQSLLFHNEGGGHFKDVTEEMGLLSDKWSGDATPLDGNDDGWPDLYVLNMQGLDGYYENQAGKSFVDKSAEYFPRTSWGAMGVKSFDVENDGDFDLLVTDMHSDMSEDIGPDRELLKSRMKWPASFLASGEQGIYGNSFFKNGGDGRFDEVSDTIGAENYWPWGVSVGDLNADGFLDAFVASSMCFPYRYGINSVWLNDSGERFVPAEFALGVEPRRPDNTLKPWFELDCDGDDSENPVCRGRTGRLVVWSCRGTRSAVIFDWDRDGDLDILTNEFNSRPMALISDLSERRDVKWLQIRLEGTKSNRDGLGAVVRVHLPTGEILTRRHDGKSGYLSQSSLPLYIGLGDADAASAIDIRWPSGSEQHLTGPIASGQVLTIEESNSND